MLASSPPPPLRLLTLSLQHVLVMYAGAVAVPLILGSALKLPRDQIALLINADLFACGVATIIQSYGFGPFGIRLPVMMGVTFASVAPMLAMAGNPALGLTAIAGPAQTVGPLVAPMAESAVAAQGNDDPDHVRALAAATDNIGLFFGEDIFIAIGSILLMKEVLEGYGIVLEPFHLSVWAIPTAIFAFFIHGARLLLLDRALARHPRASGDPAESKNLGSRVRGNDEKP